MIKLIRRSWKYLTAKLTGQFIEMNEDDPLGKPSFDRFASGFESGQRDYGFEESVHDTWTYEEVNLSIEKSGVGFLAMPGLLLSAHKNWTLEHGAAARSPLRRKAVLKPEEARVVINPSPLAALDTSNGTMKATASPSISAI